MPQEWLGRTPRLHDSANRSCKQPSELSGNEVVARFPPRTDQGRPAVTGRPPVPRLRRYTARPRTAAPYPLWLHPFPPLPPADSRLADHPTHSFCFDGLLLPRCLRFPVSYRSRETASEASDLHQHLALADFESANRDLVGRGTLTLTREFEDELAVLGVARIHHTAALNRRLHITQLRAPRPVRGRQQPGAWQFINKNRGGTSVRMRAKFDGDMGGRIFHVSGDPQRRKKEGASSGQQLQFFGHLRTRGSARCRRER